MRVLLPVSHDASQQGEIQTNFHPFREMAEPCFGQAVAGGVDLTHRSDSDITPDPECSEAIPTEGLHVDNRKKSSSMMDQADKENYDLPALSDLMLEDRSSDGGSST